MKNYRILQIHNFYQIPGGEDVVVRNEKRLLEEHGHKVYTYYRSNSELAKKGIVGKLFLPFTAVFSLKTYREVKKLIVGTFSLLLLMEISIQRRSEPSA